jgi:endo-1,4-beta-mannosidase
MPPVQVSRPSLVLSGPSGPTCWLGANFWSRLGGPLMWRTFDEEVVRQELRVLADHGVDVTRSFFYWPDFHPEPFVIDATLVEEYRRFLDLHVECGMTTIPTFIVGHMSGENWDPAWRGGRDLYTDVWLVSRQAWFIREMTARFCDHPAVAAWLISNEMPIYGGGTGPMVQAVESLDHRSVTAWAEIMLQAVRAGGGTQPVSLGDGAWGLEVTGTDNGFRVRDIAERVDFLGPHTYHMTDDLARQHLTPAFICELCQLGKPVVLEEFGVTSAFTSDDNAADYYRQVLHTTLLAGATGWIAWNNTDFDLYDQDPYRHHPYELLFGVTGVDGHPKPALLELRSFRRVLDRIDVTRIRRPATGTALVVSSFLETDYPFSDQAERATLRQNLLQSYVSARLADLAPALTREVDGIPAAPLLIVPSTKALTAPTWRHLEQLAADGSTVFVSYFGGDSAAQRGPWHPDVDRFFGVEQQLRYGLNEPIPGATIEWTFTEEFGAIRPDERLGFTVNGNVNGAALLPVRATGARVVATDAAGRPALLVRDVGAGRIVLSTYPVEYLAANTPRVNPNDLVRLYGALAMVAGVRPAMSVDDPRVFADVLEHEDGRRFGWIVNLAGGKVTVRPLLPDGAGLTNVDDGTPVAREFTMDPYGVEVFEVTAAPDS